MEPQIDWTEAERLFPGCSVVWDVSGFNWTPELRLDLSTDDKPVLKAGDPNCGYECSCMCSTWDAVKEEWVSDWIELVKRMRLEKKARRKTK